MVSTPMGLLCTARLVRSHVMKFTAHVAGCQAENQQYSVMH